MNSCGDYRVGALVRVQYNQRIVTHITPRWAYGKIAEIVRVNKLSLSVKLLGFTGERFRIDFVDAVLLYSEEGR